MYIACITKITWFSAILWGRGWESPHIWMPEVSVLVYVTAFSYPHRCRSILKKSEGFNWGLLKTTLVRNEARGKSTNLLQPIRAKRNFSVNCVISCLSPPYVQGELVIVLKDAPYWLLTMDHCFRFAVADYCKNHHCPKNAKCVNSRESFMCRCNSPGWTGDQCDKGTRTAVDNLCFIMEDLGLNKVKFSRSPCECYFTEVIPPLITFDDFRDPPPMSSFSKQIWVVPPLNPSKVFNDLLFWVLSYDWSPFCTPKNQVIPQKNPPPPAINNDRSLRIKILQNKTHIPLTIVSRGDCLGKLAM